MKDYKGRILELRNINEINTVIPKGIGVWELEGKRLAKLAQGRRVIVEIGAHRGRSAAFMASGLQHSKTKGMIYSVDLWKDEKHLEAYKKNMIALGLPHYTEPIKGSSKEVVETWDKEIDFLFIDGNHSFAHCKQDFELWIPFVKRGGLIAFHDYGNPNWEGVLRFVDSIPESLVKCIGVHETLWSGLRQ